MSSNMPVVTMIFGALLIALGVIGYVATGQASVTALIPSFFGIAFLGLGAMARKESLLKHAMHGAALLTLLGIGGSIGGLAKLPTVLSGTAERPAAVLSQASMAALSVVFLVLCIRSFIAARKAREQGA
ncbi:MAG: hypothetical protein AAGN66_24200 [Acidobacteriota bacterium]